MYDELIKNLRKVESGEYCVIASTEDFPVMQFVKDAADAIEELQKDLERSKDFEAFWQHEAEEALKKFQVAISNKSRWIPVTERLPERHGHYFICVVGGEDGQVRYDTIGYFGKDRFRWEHLGQEYPEKVSHWIPLPELPKDGKE